MKPTALIDGDIIAYRLAARYQSAPPWDEATADVPTFDEKGLTFGIKRTIREWTEQAGAGDSIVLLTGVANFRKLVEPTYKSNRSSTAKPVGLGFARSVLLSEYRAKMVEGLEADDLIGLMLTGTMADGRGVAVSLDKDLRTIPGLHVNPLKDSQVVAVTAAQADHMWMTQTLTGDAVDGYAGAKGVGPAGAAKLLPRAASVAALWPAVLAGFAKAKMTREDAIRNARLARILRTGDYDKTTQEVLLWHPSGEPERL